MIANHHAAWTVRHGRALTPAQHRLFSLLFGGLLLAGLLLPTPAAPPAPWKLGAPIVTYWAGPGDTLPLDDRAAAQLAAGGWNLGWTKRPADLDLYHRHGLRAMLEIGKPDVTDDAKAAELAKIISQVRDHPALYAYYLVDEPGAGAFPALGRLVAFLRQHDPAHLAYINLFPTYATDEQLQVSDDAAARARVGIPQEFGAVADAGTVLRYREHLRQFVETVRPDLISYDHYHFLKNSDGAQYFLNLALIRRAALEAGKPFLNIIQACDSPSEGWRGPGEHEIRWLMFTSLAYGASGISHFRYDTGLCLPGGAANALYWPVTRMNRDFLAMATELQPLRSLAAYHTGPIPEGAQALPRGQPCAPVNPAQKLVLGYFGKTAKRPTHVVVVNLDYTGDRAVPLSAPDRLEVFHAPTRRWQPAKHPATLDLAPGGAALLRWARP